MRPLLLSTSFWLLLGLVLYGLARGVRGERLSLTQVLRLCEQRSVVVFLLVGGAVNLALRLTAGYINPRDFVQDYVAATEFMAGRSLYPQDLATIGAEAVTNEPFPGRSWLESNPVFRGEFLHLTETAPANAHPPIVGVVLGVPAELLGLRGTYLIVALGLMWLVLWSVRVILREYDLNPSTWQWLALIGLLAGWHPLNAAIRSAQPGILLLGLVVGGWAALRNARQVLAGVLIGLAACIQAFPLLLVAYLAVRRQAAFVASLLTIAGVTAIVAAITPPGTSTEWGTTMAWIAPQFVGVTENMSLTGLTIRSARSVGHDPDFKVVALGWMTLVVFAGVALLLPGRWMTRSRDVLDREVGLGVALMLLLSPLTWTRYFPLLLLPIVTASIIVAKGADNFAKVGGLIVALLMLSIPDGTVVALAKWLDSAGYEAAALLPAAMITVAIAWIGLLLAGDLRRSLLLGRSRSAVTPVWTSKP